MKCHEPGPPLLFTMIMNAMVMPRTTSSESRRCSGAFGAVAGLVIVGAVADLIIGERRLPCDWVAHKLRGQGIVRQAAEMFECKLQLPSRWDGQPNFSNIHRAESILEKRGAKF